MSRIVKLQRKGNQISQDCDVYIGRRCVMGGWNLERSIWANPFSITEYGRDISLAKYEDYVRHDKSLMDKLETLRGKVLGCWCTPEKCHGEILIKLLAEKDTKYGKI